MLYQIFSLLLEVAVGVLAGACLLRLYMQSLRIPMSARSGNPLGRIIFALTDWIVLPLRRVLPSLGWLDTASLVATFLLELAEFGVLWLLAGGAGGLYAVPILAGFGVLRMAISGLTALVIVYAVLTWVATHSPMAEVIERLVNPLLALLPLIDAGPGQDSDCGQLGRDARLGPRAQANPGQTPK